MAPKSGRLIAVAIATAVFLLAGMASAQAPGRDVTHAVVLPVIDQTGKAPPSVLEKATAAVALALEDSGQFTVSSTADLARELAALDLRPPLNKEEQLRLAERLHADRVVTGYLLSLEVDAKAGAGKCTLELRALDVSAEEVTAGGIGNAVMPPLPGWSGDAIAITNQLLRQAAEMAVREMQARKVRRGFVEMVDDLGVVHINLGLNDGLQIGQELVVMRGYWQRETETSTLRRIGTLLVRTVEADRCTATMTSGMPPRTGDRVYVLYQPLAQRVAAERGKKITRSTRLLAALAAAVGITAVGLGSHRQSAPGVLAYLAQDQPGENPVIRVNALQAHPVPDPYRDVKGYIIFRGNTANINTSDPANIVYAGDEPRFDDIFDPNSIGRGEINVTREWTYIGRGGDEEDASYDITYNWYYLRPGFTYYYRVRRIVSPYEIQYPQTQAAQARPAQEEWAEPEWDFEPSRDAVLSDPSDAAGPFTYILPAVPLEPLENFTPNPASISFVWQPGSAGMPVGQVGQGVLRARYVLVIWRADNLSQPIYMSEPIRPTSLDSAMSKTVNDPQGILFQGNTEYIWRIGAYVEGEARPNNRPDGFVYSRDVYFRTGPMPPGPTSAGVGGQPVRRGWWGEPRTRR